MPDSDNPSPRPPKPPANETDPRFPSGGWTGFWLQRHYTGRQYMRLHLAFAGGRLAGAGSDVIGDFAIAGTYDLKTGGCKFIKSYTGQHSVEYEGCNQNDGMWVWGLWRIRTLDSGGFHIWPVGEEDPTTKRLRSEADLPIENESKQRRRVLVPSIGEPEEAPAP